MKKILIIAIGIILTSCYRTIYTNEIESCNDICESNEGMKSINKDMDGVFCKCNNGLGKRLK
jgi:hypothetical protein